MLRLQSSVLLLFFSRTFSFASASEIQCQFQEISGDMNEIQNFTLVESEDPHGSFFNVNPKLYPEYTGFLALTKGVIVIHIYDTKSATAFTTQSAGLTNRFARLQLLLPGSDLNKAIIVDCIE